MKAKILSLILSSLLCLTLSAGKFNRVDQTLEQVKSEKNGDKKFALLYKAYEEAGAALKKEYKKENLEKVVKSLPIAFKIYDQFEILENLTTVYQSHKKDFDQLVKKHLKKEDQKKFYNHMKIALDVALRGNG